MCFSLWDSVCFHISPLEFMFPLSLSLFSLVFGSCTAEPLGTRTCRRVHTKKLADHPQFWHETNENRSKDDNRRWENHITIKMKQNDKNDSPKSVADTFSNFSKQINGYAGLTQARNREKTCKSSRVKAKWIWSGKKNRKFNQMLGIKTRLTKICVHCLRCFWMLDFVVLFACLCMFCVLFATVCHFGFWCFASPPLCTWGELEFLK